MKRYVCAIEWIVDNEIYIEEKRHIDQACNMAIDLTNYKTTIFEYVESRMTFIAPNLSMIVGASTAAKLLELPRFDETISLHCDFVRLTKEDFSWVIEMLVL